MKYLGWVNDDKFKVENPIIDPTISSFNNFIWLENFDTIKDVHKVVCSKESIAKIIEAINNDKNHQLIFGKTLTAKK